MNRGIPIGMILGCVILAGAILIVNALVDRDPPEPGRLEVTSFLRANCPGDTDEDIEGVLMMIERFRLDGYTFTDAVARCWQMPEETGEPLRVGQFRAFVACAFQVYE